MPLENAFGEPIKEGGNLALQSLGRSVSYAVPVYGEIVNCLDLLEKSGRRSKKETGALAAIYTAFHLAKYPIYWQIGKAIMENPAVQHFINEVGRNLNTLPNLTSLI